MKILIIALNFHPELTGIGKYSGEMADWLSKQGHQVRVIAAPPYYPDWKIGENYSSYSYRSEVWRGIKVIRAPLWIPKTPGGLKRLVHLFSFAMSSIPPMLLQCKWRPDIIWVTEPPLFCSPAVLGLARLVGAKTWLHIQDYEVDAAFGLGLLRGARLRGAVLRFERWLMRQFDVVSTISRNMKRLALKKGVDASRLVLFPNWVDLKSIVPMVGPGKFRIDLGIPADAIVAMYSGNMGGKQGLEVLAEAARSLRNDKNVYLLLCGNGSGREQLVKECVGLNNVRFMDLQPAERLSELLGTADIHLLPQRADAADLVMPSKLTGMLSSGRVVVAGAREGTELADVLAGIGVVVPPEDGGALADAIRNLAADPALRKEFGARGRIYAETHLDMDAVLSSFSHELRKLNDN